MLRIPLQTDNLPTMYNLGIETRTPAKVKIMVVNPFKQGTVYLDRWMDVSGKQDFEIRLPQSCEKPLLIVDSSSGPNNFRITKLEKATLPQCLYCLNSKDKDFLKFAQQFAENSSILSTGVYMSDSGKYQIDYLPEILDDKTKQAIPTPARIHNATGRMEVSKKHYAQMTVPEKVGILCHEYSHVFKNEDSRDEVEADLNGLKVYLATGYPIIEAHKCFLNVFKDVPSQQNHERYAYLKTFIDNFDKLKRKIC
jgi:hypothetical protein